MNASSRTALARVISKKLRRFPKASQGAAPPRGWLRAIRLATGMPAIYGGRKLGLTQQAFDALERSEASGAISLKSLRRAANAIDCDVVYAVVPRAGSLQKMIERKALARAREEILPIAHSMRLEDQGSPSGPVIREVAKKLAARRSRSLWSK